MGICAIWLKAVLKLKLLNHSLCTQTAHRTSGGIFRVILSTGEQKVMRF